MFGRKNRFPNQGASELNSFTSWNTISSGMNNVRNYSKGILAQAASAGEIHSRNIEGHAKIQYDQFTSGIGGIRGKIRGATGQKVDASIESFLQKLQSSGGHKIGSSDLSKAIADLHKEIGKIATTMGGVQGNILKDFTRDLKEAKNAAAKGGIGALGGGTRDSIRTAFGLRTDNSIDEARKKIAADVRNASKSLSDPTLKQAVAQVIGEMHRLSNAAKTSAEKQKILSDAQTRLSRISGRATGTDSTVMEEIVNTTKKTSSELAKDIKGQTATRKGLEFNNRIANLTHSIGSITRYIVPLKRTLDIGNASFQAVNSKFNQFARMQMRVSAERGGFGRQVRGSGINYGHMMAAIGAGRSAGMEDRQVVGQMVGLQTQLAQARWGEGGLAENVGRWGISVYNGAGDVKQAHEMMIEFSRKLRSLGSDMEKLQFLHAIGRSPEEMEYVTNYEKSARRMEWLKKNPHMMGVLERADMLDESGLNAKADAATKIELRRRELLTQNAIEKGPLEAFKRSMHTDNWLFNDWTARQKGVTQAKSELATERLIRAINEKIRQDEKNGRKSSDFSSVIATLSPDDIASLSAAMRKDKENSGDKSVTASIEKDYIRNLGIAFDTRTPFEKFTDSLNPLIEKFANAINSLIEWLGENKGTQKVISGITKGVEFAGENPWTTAGIGIGGIIGAKLLKRKVKSVWDKGKGEKGGSGGGGTPSGGGGSGKSPISPRNVTPKNNFPKGAGHVYSVDAPYMEGGRLNLDKQLEALDKEGLKGSGKTVGKDIGKAEAKGIGKKVTNGASKAAAKGTSKAVAKGVGKAAGKGIWKSIAKKIPFLGWLPALLFASQRAMAGDFSGAGLEVASGALGSIPGAGTIASGAIDAGLIARDIYQETEGAEGKGKWKSVVASTSSANTDVGGVKTAEAMTAGQKLIESIRDLIKSNASPEEVQGLLAKNKISVSLDSLKSDKFMKDNAFANQVMKGGQALNVLEEYASKTGNAISYEEYGNKVKGNKYISAAYRNGLDVTREDEIAAATGKGNMSSRIIENYMKNPLSTIEMSQERYKVKNEHADWSDSEVEKEVRKRSNQNLTQEDYEAEKNAILDLEGKKALLGGNNASEFVAMRDEYEKVRKSSGAAKDGYFYGRLEDGSVGRLNDQGNWISDEGNELAGEDGKPIHVRDITDDDRRNRDRMMEILKHNPNITDQKSYEAAKLLSATPEEQEEYALKEMQKRGIDVANRTESQKFKSEQAAGFEKFRNSNKHLSLAEAISTYAYRTDLSKDTIRNLVGYGKKEEDLSEEEKEEKHKGSEYRAEEKNKESEKKIAERKKKWTEAAKNVSREEAEEYLGDKGDAAAYIRLRNRVEGGATLDEKEKSAYENYTDIVGKKASRAKRSKNYRPLNTPYNPTKGEQAEIDAADKESARLVKKQKESKGKPPLAQVSDIRYMHSIRARGGMTRRELARNFGKERMEQYLAAAAKGELSEIDPKVLKREKKLEARQARRDRRLAKAGVVRSGFPQEGDALQKMATAGELTEEASKKMADKGAAAESAAASAKNATGSGSSSTEKNITINMGGQTITQNIQGEHSMDAEGMKKGTQQGASEIRQETAEYLVSVLESKGTY